MDAAATFRSISVSDAQKRLRCAQTSRTFSLTFNPFGTRQTRSHTARLALLVHACLQSCSQKSSILSSCLMSDSLSRTSALPDNADALALLHVALAKPSQVGALPNSSCSNRKPSKPRKPKKGCEIAQSSFRPHVLARDCLHHWTAPISDTFHSKLVKDFALDDIIQLFNVLLVSIKPKT